MLERLTGALRIRRIETPPEHTAAHASRVAELPAPAAFRDREIDPVVIGAKLDEVVRGLDGASKRANEVTASLLGWSGLMGRFKQSILPLQTLEPSDLKAMPESERWQHGIALGRALSELMRAVPAASAKLEQAGKKAKADDVGTAYEHLLEQVAQKLSDVPITPPAFVPLLGDPPQITKDNAPAIVEQLKADPSLTALFLTDSIAEELKKAGLDPNGVDTMKTEGKSRRARLSLEARKALVVAATVLVSVPALLSLPTGGGVSDAHHGPNSPPANTPVAVRDVVEQTNVHQPIKVRVPEKKAPSEQAIAETRAAVEAGTLPEGVPQQTVVAHLEAAGFKPTPSEQITDVTPLETAVGTFQASVGLEPTGVVDLPTLERLDDSIIPAAPHNFDFSPAQTEGERSESVEKSERVLAELGLLPEKEVDGKFTQVTTEASQTFEESHPGLGRDGSIDGEQFRAMTKALLGKLVSKPDWVEAPSANHTPRYGRDIDTIVLHHTASNDTQGDLSTLTSAGSGVSAHYLVGRDGTIYHLVDDNLQAWHAGESIFRGEPSVNLRSIGIEITNDGSGHTPFTEQQYKALTQLVPYLAQRYDIPIENIVGHKEIAIPVGRKSDPAPNFEEGRINAAVERAEHLEHQLG
jgi:N-acetylmuramoyl-L-alanine amidase